MTLPNSIAPLEGARRVSLSPPPPLKTAPMAVTPARLIRPQGGMPWPLKLLSLVPYEPGDANRSQWPSQTPAPLHNPRRLAPVPKPTPAATLSAWQRVCENKGVQRALAIGKLAADGLDLLGAMIVAPITGAAIYDVVLKNLKADGQQLLTGKPARADSAGTRTASQATGAAADLVSGLSAARDSLNKFDPLKARKLQAWRRAAWGRGLTFAASLFMIGASGALAAANPVLGGVALVLSVYTARQAYANWRLARENLNHLRAARPTSPMGNNALAHVLNQAYLQERPVDASPSEIQARAARGAAMVGFATVAASVAVGGVAMTAGAALPTLVSHLRHAVRGVGGVVAPVTEVVDSYVTEERSADLTNKRGFDQASSLHWQAFFTEQPNQVAVYQSALGRYVDYQQGSLPRPRPLRVTVRETEMDIGPLIRWTRETRRLADLQAWLALDAHRTGDLNWAQRVFEDLEVIDGNRVKLRGTSVLGALASATPSAVSLAL